MNDSLLKIALVVLLSWSVTPAGVAHAEPASGGPDGSVVHVVLVWLEEPGNAAHRQRIIEASKRFERIPGVLDLRVGRVIPGERDVVEDGYDVALYMRFASRADQRAYLSHPLHEKTVENEFKPIMARFRVIDFRDE